MLRLVSFCNPGIFNAKNKAVICLKEVRSKVALVTFQVKYAFREASQLHSNILRIISAYMAKVDVVCSRS